MSRRRVATQAECERVRELAAAGVSLRAIASSVFGDRRLKGRVERILSPRRREPSVVRSREEAIEVLRKAGMSGEQARAIFDA